mmetsp:Transcript_64531/g.120087  ORF Transcript_64531/g.120087 Transcript_64531/m.120087 type:complete len:183 (-) Transcript_64531:27-575(-)
MAMAARRLVRGWNKIGSSTALQLRRVHARHHISFSHNAAILKPTGLCGASIRLAASRTGRGDVGDAVEIDETEYHHLADKTLTCLHDTLDAAELESLDDIALDDGVLKVQLASGDTFIINKHFATKQVWYASPVSGALYFSPDAEHGWFCAAAEGDLVSIFRKDLVQVCPEAESIDLSACSS